MHRRNVDLEEDDLELTTPNLTTADLSPIDTITCHDHVSRPTSLVMMGRPPAKSK
jgi:hypothetical protein